MLADTLRNHLATISYINDHLITLPDGTQALRPEVAPPSPTPLDALHAAGLLRGKPQRKRARACPLLHSSKRCTCSRVARKRKPSFPRGTRRYQRPDPSASTSAPCRTRFKARRTGRPPAPHPPPVEALPSPCASTCRRVLPLSLSHARPPSVFAREPSPAIPHDYRIRLSILLGPGVVNAPPIEEWDSNRARARNHDGRVQQNNPQTWWWCVQGGPRARGSHVE